MYLRSWPLAAASFLPLLLTSGCSSSRHDPTETYYLVASNTKLPYWQSALAGLTRGANELQVHAKMVGPDKYDARDQVQQFREVLAKKPAGILVSAADPEMMRPEIDAAIAAGIPVITMDSDSPRSKRLFFIGTNNYQAGVTGGRVLAQRLNRKGNVVVYTIPAQENLIQRLRGYEDALSDTGVKIVQVVDVHGDPATAFDKTMEIVNHPKSNIDAFVCLEATACKEVADVLSRNKVQGKTVIAMDTDEGTLDWIEKGAIAATVAQKPYTMAYFGVRMLDSLHHNKPAKLDSNWAQDLRALMPSVVDTGSSLIDRTNVSTVRKSASPESAELRLPFSAEP